MRSGPSPRQVLEQATIANGELGHENLGALSSSRGFLPGTPPLLELPESHRAWDEVARELPGLHASLRLRSRLLAVPELDTSEDALPDRYLHRAATALGLMVHAHLRVQPWRPTTPPPGLERAWTEICRRLGREAPLLGYSDLILNNWRHTLETDELRVETMDLLVPTVGHREEQVFYLTQVEMHAVGAPVVDACVAIHEAVVAGDHAVLVTQLDSVAETLTALIRRSLPKIDPNPHAPTYVDPVVWAKTVAPLAVPIREGMIGPSGTSSPLFHLLDVLFGRKRYASQLGHEAQRLRATFPQHWRSFIDAVAATDLPAYVEQARDRQLTAAFAKACELYVGEDGILERHRLKVAGFIEMAFKLGRNMTIGGFSGQFQDRTWREIDAQLVASREDRHSKVRSHTHRLPVVRPDSGSHPDDARVRRVVLDTAGSGLRSAAGDRCLVFARQDPRLVERTLRVLGARGDETIVLDPAWRSAMQSRGTTADRAGVADVLEMGELRPVSRHVAKALLDLSADERLEGILEARTEDQWELPDLLGLLAERGWDPGVLLSGEPGERTSLCRVVPPVVPRVYSVSSDQAAHHDELHLTVARHEYRAGQTASQPQHGTASWYLTAGPEGRQVDVSLRRSAAFAPPTDPTTPIILVAGGSGVSPLLAFLQHRAATAATGDCWLLLGVRDSSELVYREELQQLVGVLPLHVRVAFSRDDHAVEIARMKDGAQLNVVPGRRRRLTELMLEPDVSDALWRLMGEASDAGAGAVLYVCGAAGFSAGIAESLHEVFRRHGDLPEQAAARFRRLSAARRYIAEVFTTYTGAHAGIKRLVDASELSRHASDSDNPWMAISGRVYDLSEFRELHPGGDLLLDGYAGTDATSAYERVEHHQHAEVSALLSLYELGAVRRLDLGREWGTFIGNDGLSVVLLKDLYRAWVRLLYLAIEMHNAARTDFGVRFRRTTSADAAGALTPYTLQFCIEAHERFMLNNAELMGAPLEQVWAMAAGLCDPGRDGRQLSAELSKARADDNVRIAEASGKPLYAALEQSVADNDGDALERLDRCCSALVAADRRLQDDLVSALRSGVEIFEAHEAATLREAGPELLAALLGLTTSVTEHARRACEALSMLPRDSSRFSEPS